ncbi:GDYXXLXY domain-containing protein [Salipaludibacillus daqingensis]|uniref:GDYXXLXY domain-containing protein n=1 Tax=Salipaludibacillus daqingensis TaxID=3041001 RepID=UPI0024750284|nr:GDYXXLXY domain-containing protein [Salipaludibacillus daqingensis]
MKNFLFPFAQTLFVSILVLSFYAISWFGESYVLRAEPYDPFDPFYGEYVMLQYPDLTATDTIEPGTIYFTIKEGPDRFAVIDKIENEPFFGAIRGYSYDNRIVTEQLEQFYVEQGLGPELEDARDLQLTVDVAPWGSIRPKDLEIRNE